MNTSDLSDTLPDGLGLRAGMPRILVAEDDDEMRALVVGTLRDDGYDVVEARSGHEAMKTILALAASNTEADPADIGVDLLLTDVRMPGASGLGLVDALHRVMRSVPTVLMTAFPDDEVHSEAVRLGVPVLAKPFRLDFLRRIVLATLTAANAPEDRDAGLDP
ncbi:MAG: response regulator [Polyangiaceae bacterium]